MPKSTDEPIDDDDVPTLTKADFARMRPAVELLGEGFIASLARSQRAKSTSSVRVRLSNDVIRHLRARGRGWHDDVNAALRRLIEAGEI